MGKRLLVVDSDRRFIQDHKSPLESAFEVDFLFATEGALTRLESGQYGAILLCVETDNKGYALCSAIRRAPANNDLKIALISAKASEEEYVRHRGTKGKADLYLHKPITAQALVPALAGLVPMKEDDPDNPLGDLAGTDLGDEWLESLKTELETEPPALVESPAFVPAPAPAPPAPAPPAPEVERRVAPPRNQGEIELLQWRVKDLEEKLATQFADLGRKNREIEELTQSNAAVTRNLDEVQKSQTDGEVLRQKLAQQEGIITKVREDLQDALDEQKRLVDQMEEVNVLLSEKTQQHAELTESHQLLQAQLEESWEMGDRVRVLEGSLAEAQESVKTLEARAGVAEQNRADLQQELESVRAELAVKQARIQELEPLQHRLRDLEKSSEGAASRIQDLERDLASAQEQVSFQEHALRNLAEEKAALQSAREHLDDALTEQSGELLTLQEKLAMAEASSKGARTLQQQLESTVASLEKQLEANETAHELQQRELLAGIDEREAHLGRLNSTLDAQRESISHLEQEKEALGRRAQGLGERMHALTGIITELEGKARQALDLTKAVTD